MRYILVCRLESRPVCCSVVHCDMVAVMYTQISVKMVTSEIVIVSVRFKEGGTIFKYSLCNCDIKESAYKSPFKIIL